MVSEWRSVPVIHNRTPGPNRQIRFYGPNAKQPGADGGEKISTDIHPPEDPIGLYAGPILCFVCVCEFFLMELDGIYPGQRDLANYGHRGGIGIFWGPIAP